MLELGFGGLFSLLTSMHKTHICRPQHGRFLWRIGFSLWGEYASCCNESIEAHVQQDGGAMAGEREGKIKIACADVIIQGVYNIYKWNGL